MNSRKLSDFPRKSVTILIVISFLPSLSGPQRVIVYPCTSFEAISWVRDPTSCDQYYICHFGQPLAMPLCPSGQVWSNGALNCVPRESRWNDCINKSERRNFDKTNNIGTATPQITDIPSEVSPSDIKETSIVTVSSELSPVKIKHLFSSTKSVVNTWQNRITSSHPGYVFEITESSVGDQQSPDPREFAPIFIDAIDGSNRYLQEKQHKHTSVQENNPGFRHHGYSSNLQRLHVTLDHQCTHSPGELLPHPEQCHWYFNCSLANQDGEDMEPLQTVYEAVHNNNKQTFLPLNPSRVPQAGVLVWECPYPQLFDDVSGRCREFVNVFCKSKFEPLDRCEYSRYACSHSRCIPCDQQFGRCRGRPDGVYPLHETQWTPVFITCYRERNIAQDECASPTPIFSPEQQDCVSLFEVPKLYGGLLPDCNARPDGYYPDEQGRCAIFFRCSLGRFLGYDECPPGSVFDPAVPACQPYSFASRPCGEGQAPLCGGKVDGFYSDPYGRCTNYFQCKQGVYQQYFTCDTGVFDPLIQRCVAATELTLRPCGLQPSPCEELPTGVYPDQSTGCKHFIECQHGHMITNGTCKSGQVFSAITGRCGLPVYAPPPCGVSTTCSGQPDGRYPAVDRGCSFYYECYNQVFLGLRRCTDSDGGFFFNPETGACDYPQNICPPCGHKWWGCSKRHQQ